MLIHGKEIAGKILQQVEILVKKQSFQPIFCDILIGDDPVSLSFVQVKQRAAEAVGIHFQLEHLPGTATETDILARIAELNRKPGLCGLIVQLPLPRHLDKNKILDAIDPLLDVDCLGSENMQKFYSGSAYLLPPTAHAVISVLSSIKTDISQSTVLVCGQGELVGKPVAHMLRPRVRTLLIADNSTKDLTALTAQADIIIAGTGQPGLITGSMVKAGSIVIDAGTSEMNGGIVGDVEKTTVADKVSWLAAVPGGVGPVTVAQLLNNVAKVAGEHLAKNNK